MGLFDFGKLKSALSGYTDSLADIRSKIEILDREIEDVTFAPVSKDDIKAALASWIESRRNRWSTAVAEKFSALAARPEVFGQGDPAPFLETMRRQALPVISEYNGNLHADGIQDMLIGLMGDQVKAALQRAVDELPWPEGCITAADRIQRLAKLNATREKLLNDEHELVAVAERVGLNPDRVGV